MSDEEPGFYPCKFCGDSVVVGTERCPHCGGKLIRTSPGVGEVGHEREGYQPKHEREEDQVLGPGIAWVGFSLLILGISVATVGPPERPSDPLPLWEAIRMVGPQILIFGAWLCSMGSLYWKTKHPVFAVLSALGWLAFLLVPLGILLGATSPGELIRVLSRTRNPAKALIGLLVYAGVAVAPMIYAYRAGAFKRREPT